MPFGQDQNALFFNIYYMTNRSYFISIQLIFLYALVFLNIATAQKDSLFLLIEHTTDPKEKVDLYNKLARLYTDTAFTEALKFSDIAYQLAVDNKYPEGEAQSLYNLSLIHI